MKTARTLVGFLVGLVALGGSPVPACPVNPPSLWELIQKAEWIVLGRVEQLEPVAETGGDAESLESSATVFTVLETWKGPSGAQVRVNHSGSLFAGDRRVVVGDHVLLFLESGEGQSQRRQEAQRAVTETAVSEETAEPGEAIVLDDDEQMSPEELLAGEELVRRWEESRIGRWFVAGFGFGVRAVQKEDSDSLRELLDEAVRLQEASGVPDEALRAWLVRAAGLRATRADALSDLRRLLPHEGRLSEDERRSIADAFVRDPAADSSVPALLALLSGDEDTSFDRAVISVIEAGVAAPQIPSWVPEAIRHLIVRSGWQDWGAEIWERYRVQGKLKEIWRAVASDLRLPSVPPARVRVSESPGE